MGNKRYKPSVYNVIIDEESGDLIVANTLSCNIERYSSECSEKIKKILSSDIIDELDETSEFLLKDSFIVNEDTLESAFAEYQLSKKLYSNQRLELTIVPTESCNMRCVYCFEEHRTNYMTDESVRSLIKFLKKRMRTASGVLIRWFGGEPLLCTEKIIQVMTAAQYFGTVYKIPVEGQMTTNGVLLDGDILERLRSCGVRNYQITLNGFREAHNRYRPMVDGSDSFSVISDNLRSVLKHNKRVSITIRVNVMKDMLADVREFIDYLNENYLFDNRFSLMLINVRNLGGDRVKNMELLRYDELDEIMEYAAEIGVSAVNSAGLDGYEMCCEASSVNSFYIDWDLSVYKCGNTIYSENKELGQIGKIDTQGIMKIDEHKMALWMEKKMISENCPDCCYYPVCMSHYCPYSINIFGSKNCSDHKAYLRDRIISGGKRKSPKTI